MKHCLDVQDKEQMFETIILLSVFSPLGSYCFLPIWTGAY